MPQCGETKSFWTIVYPGESCWQLGEIQSYHLSITYYVPGIGPFYIYRLAW